MRRARGELLAKSSWSSLLALGQDDGWDGWVCEGLSLCETGWLGNLGLVFFLAQGSRPPFFCSLWLQTVFVFVAPLVVGMESALLNVRSHGLSHAFLPDDLRQQTCGGLWPGSDMVNDQVLEAKLKELCNCLVADSYGGVDAVKWARNAYNSRLTQINEQ